MAGTGADVRLQVETKDRRRRLAFRDRGRVDYVQGSWKRTPQLGQW
jgi:hypothetical protein